MSTSLSVGPMEFTRLGPDVVAITPRVFSDDRGWFLESFSHRVFAEALGVEHTFVQDNHSQSEPWVLRGIHYQLPPHAQGKLVRVVRGAVFDVAVDLRRSSPGFGTWKGIELSSANRRQLWIPPGYGHAFLATEDGAEVVYKTTDYYAPESERTIRWDDPDLAIQWPNPVTPVLSTKDSRAPAFADAEVFESTEEEPWVDDI